MTNNGTALQQKTLELCQVILDEPEFQSLRQRLDAFMADEVLQAQYQELSEAGSELHEKQHQGLTIADHEIQAFEQKRDQFLKHPVAQGFLDAQRGMRDIRETVTRHVARTLELGRLPTEDDFQSCSCGSGSCGSH